MKAPAGMAGRRKGLATLLVLGLCASGRLALGAEPGPTGRPGGRAPLALTYIANEGVMISAGDSKVLIDALFDKPNEAYRSPSPELLERILRGDPPYDGVDLVLVTHGHPDHFDAALVDRYLAAFPGAIFAGPSDVVEVVRQVLTDRRDAAARIVSLDLEVGEKATRSLAGIRLTAFRTLHSGDERSPMNLVYRLDVNGWRMLHEGDSTGATGVCRDSALAGAPLDLALVHFWFPLDPDCARFLQEVLRPRHVALMHLPIRLEGDAPGKIDQVRKYYGDLFLLLPGTPVRTFEE